MLCSVAQNSIYIFLELQLVYRLKIVIITYAERYIVIF